MNREFVDLTAEAKRIAIIRYHWIYCRLKDFENRSQFSGFSIFIIHVIYIDTTAASVTVILMCFLFFICIALRSGGSIFQVK